MENDNEFMFDRMDSISISTSDSNDSGGNTSQNNNNSNILNPKVRSTSLRRITDANKSIGSTGSELTQVFIDT